MHSLAMRPSSVMRAFRRLAALAFLLVLSVSLYHWLSTVAPPSDGNPLLFLPVWALCFLPYFAACAFVLLTRPLDGWWRWIELGLVGLGAVAFRVMLLPLPPGLSRDVWRYLWDARVVLHGYSPYVYAPGAKVLEPLRNVLFYQCRFRNIPTDYPPGAEAIFLPAYLLDPRSLAGIKLIFVGFELTACGGLALLLARRGLDPRRAIIYAWCPLPIVEFAIEGHLDAVAIAFTVLAVLTATSESRSARIGAGLFLGAATLVRLYPVLILPLLLRRRDGWLLVSLALTVILGYLPFLILGHGQVLGFLLSYTGQQGGNAGLVQAVVRRASAGMGLSAARTLDLEYAVDALLLVVVEIGIVTACRRRAMSVDLGILILFGTIFLVSSHVFPWYLPALLPWIALSVQPLRMDRASIARAAPVLVAWYVVCTGLVSYARQAAGVSTAPWWAAPFYTADALTVILAMVAAILIVYACLSRATDPRRAHL